jgi:hypothetical protein
MPRFPTDGPRKHQLLPDSVAKKLPPLRGQEKNPDPIAHVKLFSPYSGATWFLTEYDPKTGEAFGWADMGMGMGEYGYIDVGDLAMTVRVMRGGNLPLIERDLYWKPCPMSEARRNG